MTIASAALVNLLLVVVIGAAIGLLFNRYARSWLARLGVTARSDMTGALVGIAGAFIGFHLAVVAALPSPIALYLAAAAGAAIVLWLWRGR